MSLPSRYPPISQRDVPTFAAFRGHRSAMSLPSRCPRTSQRDVPTFSVSADDRSAISLLSQRIDNRLGFLCHLQQLGPGAMIIFAGKFSGGVEAHVRPDVLRSRGVIEGIARIANNRAVAFRVGVGAQTKQHLTGI